MTSYQKLKKKINNLHIDIFNLVEGGEEKKKETELKWKHHFDTEKAVWFGTAVNSDSMKFKGIYHQIK